MSRTEKLKRLELLIEKTEKQTGEIVFIPYLDTCSEAELQDDIDELEEALSS